jgi:hypothetical protein
MKETLVKAISNVIVTAIGAGAILCIANGYRKETRKQMEKIEPMIEECTIMIKKSNKYFDIAMEKMTEV